MGRQCEGIEKQDFLTLGEVKISDVVSGYTDSIIDKLVGKQEVVYVCAQTKGLVDIRQIKSRCIQCKIHKIGLTTKQVD